jgi:hypothetical protein
MICFAYHNLEPLLRFYGKLDHVDEVDNTSNAKSMDEILLKKINVLAQQIVMACGYINEAFYINENLIPIYLRYNKTLLMFGFMDEIIQ